MPTKTRKHPPITHPLAERHEALWLKLSALHKQIAAVATRKPEIPISEQTRIVAEALLADGWVFGKGSDKLPVAAPDYGGLLTQLGQALAEMEDYELRHTAWHDDRKCFMWAVAGAPVPVRRLRQMVHDAKVGNTAATRELRRKLAIRIEQFKRR